MSAWPSVLVHMKYNQIFLQLHEQCTCGFICQVSDIDLCAILFVHKKGRFLTLPFVCAIQHKNWKEDSRS